MNSLFLWTELQSLRDNEDPLESATDDDNDPSVTVFKRDKYHGVSSVRTGSSDEENMQYTEENANSPRRRDNNIDTDNDKTYTVEEAVESIGFGRFQLIVYFVGGTITVRYLAQFLHLHKIVVVSCCLLVNKIPAEWMRQLGRCFC